MKTSIRGFTNRAAARGLLMIAGNLAGTAAAATIRVDSSRCSLQGAVAAADGDTGVGGCAAGNGDDTIRVAPGSDSVIDAGRVPAAKGDISRSALRVTQGRLTVIGNGSMIRRLPDAPCSARSRCPAAPRSGSTASRSPAS